MVFYYMPAATLEENGRKRDNMLKRISSCLKECKEIEKEITMKNSEKTHLETVLKSTNERLEKLNMQRFSLNSSIRDLKLELKKVEDSIKGAKVIHVVVVNQKHELPNGLVDLGRDVLMKTIKIVSNGQKIRHIIGMNRLFYTWSKLRIFVWARSSNASFDFLPKHYDANVIISDGRKFTFSSEGSCLENRIFVFDKEITTGIYRSEFEVVNTAWQAPHSQPGGYGLAATSVLPTLFTRWEVLGGEQDTCAFRESGILCGGSLFSTRQEQLIPRRDRVHVALELHAPAKKKEGPRILYLFVQGKLSPHVVRGVPSSVHMGFCGALHLVIEVKRFQLLSAPTTLDTVSSTKSSIFWMKHNWK